jgi:long-chain acyl-CoA synthetase
MATTDAPIGFWAWAACDPERIALISTDGATRTFGELAARSNQIARGLRKAGLGTGDAVAMLLGNEPAWIETLLATSQIGLYLTPINHHLVGAEVAYILGDCEAKVFIAAAPYAAVAREAVAAIAPVFDSTLAFATGGPIDGFRPLAELGAGEPRTPPPDRTAGQTMNYTSGTTGKPKGVRRALAPLSPDETVKILSGMLGGLFGLQPGAGCHLVAGPLYHTAPGAFAMTTLHMGHALVIMERWDAAEALRLIAAHQVTSTHLVPTMFHRLLALPSELRRQHDTSSLRQVIHAAAPCPVHVKRAMIDWWGEVIWEYYAATEGGGTVVSPQDWIAHPGTVGRPWPGSTIQILDENGNPVPPGEPGTVYMASPISPFVYYKDDDKTARGRRGELFTVGDVGRVTEDGWLFLCDRKVDMIISGGVNIYPAEIEAVLLAEPHVADVAVIGVPDEEWGESVKAIVQPAAGVTPGPALADALLGFARGKLAAYKVPRSVDFVVELPRQPSGKLSKRELRRRYWEGTGREI